MSLTDGPPGSREGVRAGWPARPTLRDVAARAGVSFKTVSRVINSEPGVRPETAARVQQAVSDLGFRRNQMASSLKRGGSSRTIGLVIGDVANPFFSMIARTVEDATRDSGLLIITASSNEDSHRERQVIDSLVEQRVKGLLVVPASRDHRFLAQELRLGMAVVFLDRPPGRLDADCVMLDNVGGARAAVEHLIARGHRRIAVLGDRLDVWTHRERSDGYRQAMEAHGLPIDPALVRFSRHDISDAESAVTELLRLADPPTAVFATNNRMSIGAVQALARWPQPIALVGFDDFELAGVVTPGITVVTYDTQEIGQRGAQLLLERMDGYDGPPRQVVLPTWIVPRGSGELEPPASAAPPAAAGDW